MAVDVEGGVRDFAVQEHEQVFYWWRGPEPRGVRLEKDRSRQRAAPLGISRAAKAAASRP